MINQTVSHYRILEKIGEGGMGEVYLAEDTSLGRTVALKFLPASLQEDPIAHKRFLREARSAAALDHPYICNIFEVAETNDGANFIAMEYLEGETLQRRLQSGPLTLKESLKLGSELAEALESAHSKGIVHRDLKPANIMITPSGHSKVMDFGLAKKLVGEDGTEQDISSALTREGATLGTLSYMSPEQLRGQSVDYRSDIFSLGIVLYEMLSGVHPFRKSQSAETTGAILKDDPPPLGRFVAELPDILRHTVDKMLAKNPAERYQSVHEVLTNLNQLREDSGKIRTAQEPGERTIPGWVWRVSTLALAVLLSALGVWELWFEQEAETTPVPLMRTSILLPEGERLASGLNFRHAVAVSPDGRWVAYVSYKPGERDEPDGDPVINLRRLDQSEVRRIPGFNPFFSPDSQQLGFLESAGQGQLHMKRTVVEGGPVETITLVDPPFSFGCVWLPDRTIVFTTSSNAGLFAVPEVGGEPRQLTSLDEEAGEYSHRLPSVLPDSQTILYTVVRFLGYPDWSRCQLVGLRLDTGEKTVLIEGGSDGRFVESGHLVFARDGTLMAVDFDPDGLKVQGDPVPLLDGLVHSVYTGNTGRETGAAQYAVSREGLLVFAPGSVYPKQLSQVVWVDRSGREAPLEIEPRTWVSARISADARQMLLTDPYPPSAVYVYDLERKTLRPQTFEGLPVFAIWGPQEGEFTFDSDPDGPQSIYVKALDMGPRAGEKLETGFWGYHKPSAWMPDGRQLAFINRDPESIIDIWILDREGERKPFLNTRFGERYPEFSPDGHWLAYTSDESGRNEVYVRPYPGPGKPVRISTTGGDEPCWSRDGREILFSLWDPSLRRRDYFAVKVTPEAEELTPGLPERLFGGNFGRATPVRSYDVAADGRFLLIKLDPDRRSRIQQAMAPTRIELVLNWFEELKQKVPTE